MHHIWVYITLAVLLLVVPFVMSPPTFVSDQFFRRFEIHPDNLSETDVVSITRGTETITGECRQDVIQDFNRAAFLSRRYSDFPTYHDLPLIIHVVRRGRSQVFKLYPYGDFIDVVTQRGKKTIVYQVKSNALKQWLLSSA